MELRELEAACAVVSHGSFTKAAEALSLSQPAVSRQIAALETELGVRLLDRLGRTVQPTAAGEALLPYAAAILRLVADARVGVSEVAEGTGGRLSIASSSTAAAYLLPPVLRAFRLGHPRVQLSVETGPSRRVAALVRSGAVDLGIVMDYRPEAEISGAVVADYGICVVAAPGITAGSAADSAEGDAAGLLASAPLIMMPPGASLRVVTDRLLAGTRLSALVSMEIDNVEAIKKIVEQGVGISVLPEIAVRGEVAEGRLVALPLPGAPIAGQQVAAIHRSDKFVTTAMDRFFALLRAALV